MAISFPARTLDRLETLYWEPSETAVIICDMWDRTICRNAERRVTEIAPRLNGLIQRLRHKGILIIHAPSGVMKFYEGTPERERASAAPFVEPPLLLDWQDLDPAREDSLPIDDRDWCDDTPKCPIREIEEREAWPWTRQIASIEIHDNDAVTSDGQEIYNLLEQRRIKNIVMTGVHLNRCVLGRPYGIRQMVMLEKRVVLVRDLTDGLYDPRQPPFVSHEEGVELLVTHVERYWCPSTRSADIV